jgi:hypothetical protein
LANRNSVRYQGQQERVALEAFAPGDRELLHRAYSILLELYQSLRPVHGEPDACRRLLNAFVAGVDYRELAATMSNLGRSTTSVPGAHQVYRHVHDLRGGAYQALFFRLQLFEAAPGEAAVLQGVYFLVRDHLKIMRNCVSDLDPVLFAADTATVNHDVGLLVEKWSQPEFNGTGGAVQVGLQCHYKGTLCESCLEFSSLDRIIYNLMNNAASYTADGAIVFNIAGVPALEPAAVRFVVANAVPPAHHQALLAHFGDTPGELFRGGFTTGGHGIGTRICADFCMHAFGVSDFDEALNAGYFGARWIDEVLAVWFHWPIVAH